MSETEKLREKPEEFPIEVDRSDVIPLMKQFQFDWDELQELYTSQEAFPQLDQDSPSSGNQVDQ